jgi:TPR repeat protein
MCDELRASVVNAVVGGCKKSTGRVLAVMIGLVALSAETGLAQPKAPRQIAQEAFASVVFLVMQDSSGQPVSFGSGFVLREGLVATSLHVINGASSGYCKVIGGNAPLQIAGTVAVDAEHDLAIVAISGLDAPVSMVGDSGQVAVGDPVYAIGNPEGLEGTFSQGIVSGVRRIGNETVLQITAPISPGSSGGPILDSSGRVIGIVVATLKEGQNLNLAVPSSDLTGLSARISDHILPLAHLQAGGYTAAVAQPAPQTDSSPYLANLRYAAEHGDASAQINLGRAHLLGQGVPKDHAAAFTWYRKAAEQGHVYAQSILGTFYYSGDGVTRDPGAALRWWRKAAEQGDTFAEQAIGVLYSDGDGVPKDDAEAAKWFRKSAEHGNALGQLKLGAAYVPGDGVPKDYSEAAKWIGRAAEQGNASAQGLLAELYSHGWGAAQDLSQAAAWFRKAAEQGDAMALGNLGRMYATGTGVTQNYAESLKWYRKAAEQGDATGQVGLGQLYYLGYGVPQDFTEAAKWYRKAAEAGDTIAQVKLGLLYTDPKKGVENYAEGANWLRKAVEQGDEDAKFILGLLYEFGRGVPQDYVLAHVWYKLCAASPGQSRERQAQARERREAVAARMTGEQIAEAQRLAREWKPKKTN